MQCLCGASECMNVMSVGSKFNPKELPRLWWVTAVHEDIVTDI